MSLEPVKPCQKISYNISNHLGASAYKLQPISVEKLTQQLKSDGACRVVPGIAGSADKFSLDQPGSHSSSGWRGCFVRPGKGRASALEHFS